MIRENIIDRQAQTADIACVVFDKADGRFIAACFSGILESTWVIVKTIHRTRNAVVTAVAGEPQPDITPARGYIEKADVAMIVACRTRLICEINRFMYLKSRNVVNSGFSSAVVSSISSVDTARCERSGNQ